MFDKKQMAAQKVHDFKSYSLPHKRWKFLSIGLGAILLAQVLLSIFEYKVMHVHESNAECVHSFGSYKGDVYTTKETIGKPKCWLESKWMRIQQHNVLFPGQSSPIPDWLWIDYHDRINVLVEAPSLSGERQFFVFEQTKYALEGRTSKAIIGGIIEPGEKPDIAAHREVEEEMGLKCETMHFLGRFRTDVNRGMGWVNSFLATHCEKILRKVNADESDQVGTADAERQDLVKLSLSDVRKAVRQGEFIEVQWSNTVSLAILHSELLDSE